jgi:hypothetical protein
MENAAPGQQNDVDGFVEDFDGDDLLDDVGEVLACHKVSHQTDTGSGILPMEELAVMVQGETLVQASQTAVGLEVEKEMTASAVSPSKAPSLALGPPLERAIMGLKEANGGVVTGGEVGLAIGDLGGVTPLNSVLAGSVQNPPLRRSKRREGTTDEDSTTRASKLVAKRNLEADEGKLYNNSFLSFSDEHISDKVKNIGISIGKDTNSVQSSVVLMKNIEKDRFKLPSVDQTCQDSHLDLEESDCEIDHLALGHLCVGLTEKLMDDNNLLYDLSSRASKNGSVAKIKVVDRKTKIKKLQPTQRRQTTKKQNVLK